MIHTHLLLCTLFFINPKTSMVSPLPDIFYNEICLNILCHFLFLLRLLQLTHDIADEIGCRPASCRRLLLRQRGWISWGPLWTGGGHCMVSSISMNTFGEYGLIARFPESLFIIISPVIFLGSKFLSFTR